MAGSAVLFEMTDDGVAVVTLNRPKQMNAFTPELVVRLSELFIRLNEDDACRVVVLTGAGDEVFSSGADLKRLMTLMTGARDAEDDWDHALAPDLTSTDEATPWPGAQCNRAMLRDESALLKPVIAAINGSAIAGGCELVQGTDIRVCAEHAQIGLMEAKRGLFPGMGSTVRMPRQVPYAHAMEILLAAEPISAQKAKEIGFVNYVVPKAQVMPKALDLARKIATNGPVAVQQIRRSVKATLSEASVASAMRIETRHAQVVFAHPDAQEGPLAFEQKRRPVWAQSKL